MMETAIKEYKELFDKAMSLRVSPYIPSECEMLDEIVARMDEIEKEYPDIEDYVY